jgi:hypothetical protein
MISDPVVRPLATRAEFLRSAGAALPSWAAPLLLQVADVVLARVSRKATSTALSLLGPGAAIVRVPRLDTPIERVDLIMPLRRAYRALVATVARNFGSRSPLPILAVLVIGSSGLVLFGGRERTTTGDP